MLTVTANGLCGVLYRPKDRTTRKPALLVFGGTEGVVRLFRIAAVLELPLHELVKLGSSGADPVEGRPS